ncbi:cyclin-dependent kinase inhibitor 5-like [Nymphaea colorata]|nr:cyclin-dependent kinase inhibitor 5-like [Nymphaea colorata]XP_031491279.1 cyclin-dependent kinase inhibitor 5-like [Nymphaea colorata]
MGRYMRKCKGVGEVAVMEVSQVAGVRTRARALAALRRNSSAAAVVGELQVSYLELRSRRLVKSAPARGKNAELPARVPAPAEREVNSGAAAACEAEVRTSSNGSSVEDDAPGAGRCGDVSDLEVEVSLGETAVDYECSGSIREAAASSNLGEESEALESTTSPDVNNYGDHGRKTSKRSAPSVSEIEEFFAAFDKEEQRRFTERYNYDPVKDVPLAGRYEWVKVTP